MRLASQRPLMPRASAIPPMASSASPISPPRRSPTVTACDYPDIDMVLPEGADRYFHRDGTPYPKYPRRT